MSTPLAPLLPVAAGTDVRELWTYIDAQAAALNALRRQLDELTTPTGLAGRYALHPFKLYQLPDGFRDGATDTAGDWWRRFLVRAGWALGAAATGTDDEDADPDAPDIGAADNEIVVPDATAAFWFWLELGTDEAGEPTAVVRYGADPTIDASVTPYDDGVNPAWSSDQVWSEFPKPTQNHVPIGYVDTDTHSASAFAHVRQYLRADVVTVGGSGLAWQGEWTTTESYALGDVVIWSTSGPAMGAYVATAAHAASGTDYPWNGVGWAKLPNGMGPWL